MSSNSRQQSVIAARRAAVEPFAIRRVSTRQIAQLIAQQGYRQPATEEPWDHSTIVRDVVFLKRQWQDQAKNHYAEAQGHILAQYREVQRQAWLAKDYKLVLQACLQEAKLLGLEELDRAQIREIEAMIRQAAEDANLNYDEVLAAAQEIMAGAKRR